MFFKKAAETMGRFNTTYLGKRFCKLSKFQNKHDQKSICTSYLQLIDICMQLFPGKLSNRNIENTIR